MRARALPQPGFWKRLARFAAYALIQGFAALLITAAHGQERIGERIRRSSEQLR